MANILFEKITIINEDFNIEKDMFVEIKEDRISYVGKECPPGNFDRRYDGKNRLLLPGFVNSHAHTPMVLLRGYSENRTLQDWLYNSVFPFEDELTGEDVYNGMLLGIAEMLKVGIVSTSDMYFECESMCRAALETKTKFNICNAATCFDGGDFKNDSSYRETEAVLKYYHGANNGAILADASVHAEYTSIPKTVLQVREYALEKGLNMHIHLSETKKEYEECIERHGKTPTRYFYDLGAFDLNTTAAHCVWMNDEDIDILKEKNVNVATNPVSNLKLASGVMRAGKMIEKGINICIGTDGMASNNSLNMLEEIKLYAILHKGISGNPCIITPKEALKAATINGFIAQGRNDSGLIKEGYKADIIVIDTDKPWYYPEHNFINNLVYSGNGADVCMTVSDGNILYENGEYTTVDYERAKYNLCRSKDSVLEKLDKKRSL